MTLNIAEAKVAIDEFDAPTLRDHLKDAIAEIELLREIEESLRTIGEYLVKNNRWMEITPNLLNKKLSADVMQGIDQQLFGMEAKQLKTLMVVMAMRIEAKEVNAHQP